MKTEAQIVAVSCGGREEVSWWMKGDWGGNFGGEGRRTIQMPAWAIMAVPVGEGVSGCDEWRLGGGGSGVIPRTKLNWMPCPSCWLASPLLPSRGSSSALL